MSDITVQLEELMNRKGYTQSHVARAIGKSPAAISTFLSGKYNGDIKTLQSLLQGFIQRESDKDRLHHLKIDFVPTVTAKSGLEVIRMAHLENDINVIYGAAGLGKTMMLKEYANRYR
ncbi:helix-turn-helix domain-containing protein, partial [Raoultella sp. C349492]